jgi:glycosyltransferase involved in cell wall biosynthesis
MRIAMVSEHASPLATLGGVDAGGQNVHVAALSSALVRLGHAVTVYTRRDSRALPARVAMAPGVIVQHVDAGPPRTLPKDAIYRYVPEFGLQLQRLWSVDRPDVVHSHFWMSALAALAAAGPLDLPVVHTFHALGVEKRRHQGAADTSPAIRVGAEADIARRADRIVATASAEVFELSRMGANPRSLRLVPCGVDLDHFTTVGTSEPRRRDRLRIVTLSRLVPRKGIDTVIEALADAPGVELVVAGGGETPDLASDSEALRLAELARACGVGDRVSFRGRTARADVPALLRSADVVGCVPWYEPFGIVPLEAMACGKPVIVSSVGGLVDTVVDGVTGFHVAPRAPRQVARALEALRDSRLRRAMGRAGEERVRLRYAWPRIASETLEVYRGLAGRSAAAEGLATGS